MIPNQGQGPTKNNNSPQGQGQGGFGNNPRNRGGRPGQRQNAGLNSRFVRAKEFEESVFEIKRVSKKTTGGSSMGFTALVIIGNRNGKVGAGLGKAKDVSKAIQKAIAKAKQDMIGVNLKGTTIPHNVENKYSAAKIMLKPAPEGSGIIAGGSLRVVLDLAGVKNVSAKMLGSSNKLANVRCALGALQKLKKVSK